MWNTKRFKPYTAKGITRSKCIRCGEPAKFQWNVCADHNNYRAICAECDIGLNRVALEFMCHPDVDAAIETYKKRMPC